MFGKIADLASAVPKIIHYGFNQGVIIELPDLIIEVFKGTLMQIWKSVIMFAFV